MTWAQLLLAFVKLLGSVAGWARDRQLISAGEKEAIADALVVQADEIDKGRAARLRQRLADAGGVPDDQDPFRRD